MDKQDQLAVALQAALENMPYLDREASDDGWETIRPLTLREFYSDTWQGVHADELFEAAGLALAAAVRSHMGSDEVVDRAAASMVRADSGIDWSLLSDRAKSMERATARAALSAALDIGGGRG